MAEYVEGGLKKIGITLSKPVLATLCIVFGILVILLPSLLVWIVGLFLIFQGTLLLTDLWELGRMGPTAVPEGVYCSDCGTRNIKEAIFCRRCGKRLKLANQRELKDYQESAIAVTS